MSHGYNVYKVQYRLGIQDPLIPGTRYHTVVFVETEADGGGYVYHVIGDITSENGMTYQCKQGGSPEQSDTYHHKTYLGQIRVSDFQDVGRLLQSVPPPPRQRVFSPNTMKYEQCKPNGSLYGPHEERPPYSKCTEWTEQKAIPTLKRAGIIHENGVIPITQASGSQTDSKSSSGWVWDDQHQRYRYYDGEQWVWQ